MAFKSLSQATMVKRGFGQVEPNHLSARFTGEIYAQMPAAKDINVLEQGQFVKYDYANRAVNFTGAGEWMLVFNEIKLYRDWETDEDFAMIKRDYNAYVYSPLGQNSDGSLTEAQLPRIIILLDSRLLVRFLAWIQILAVSQLVIAMTVRLWKTQR